MFCCLRCVFGDLEFTDYSSHSDITALWKTEHTAANTVCVTLYVYFLSDQTLRLISPVVDINYLYSLVCP